ncbi:MAG: response regulator transcription factor [Ardenticatenaceae bacterium]|nr:response regulator transcription factor [Ardenticatenaceae bacterium]
MNLIDAKVSEMPRRVLVVDDNEQTLQVVRLTLERGGFEVLTSSSGPEALTMIKRSGLPHLALVDLNMPMMSGFEFCEALHEFSDVPVIMLTAVDEEQTIVKGIDLYAEDYVVKPFRPSELIARINRVLRRIGDFAYVLDPIVKIDEKLSVDFSNRTAFVNKEEVSLTPTETKILYILMRNAGQTVTTDFLLRRVWPLESAYEDRLHVHVHRLRRKVETEPSSPQYIISKRGAGYVFPKVSSRA